ncbi:MAG: hypothetical protein ACOYYS_23955 [Chloroflexota bacterium]
MIKKLLVLAVALGVVAVLSLGAIGFAYAQTPTPSDPAAAPRWGGRGGMMGGGMMHGYGGAYGPLHEYMIAALAESLDMTAEALQARVEAGETPYQVAQSQGLTDTQIATLFDEAHLQALQAAVEAGALTQEQADWMQSRHEQMWQNGGAGAGSCMGGSYGGRTGRGGRGGWRVQP